MPWKKIFYEVGLLVAAAVILGALVNAFRGESKKLAWLEGQRAVTASVATAPSIQPSSTPSASAGEDLRKIAPPRDPANLFDEISGDIASRLHQAGALFIDARRTEAFLRGHIQGARSIPAWERDAEGKIQSLQNGIAPDAVIVVYCTGARCEDSKKIAEKCAFAGYFNVYVYRDGFPDWEQRGGAVKEGEEP